MHPQTIERLNQLNTLFYQITANSFDATRQRPWEGWTHLLPLLARCPTEQTPLKVLDVGCGNGRFGVFLRTQIQRPVHYTGVDQSAELLRLAAQHLSDQQMETFLLVQADLLRWQPVLSYDLIVLFGVLHHIPGFANRHQLIHALCEHLSEGGILVMTFWRFMESETLRAKVVAWEDDRVPPDLQNLELEAGDMLLDWKRDTPALRYCHYADDAEIERLIEGLPLVQQYDADGSNRYVVLRR